MSSTGIYHIILRSVNQHTIFEEESDYQKFLFILSDCKKKYDSDIFAYCLMDNHVHLLLRTDNDNLSSFFQSLGTRFVRWYNTKYSRSGHLFQDRFFSSVIENDTAFLSALVYIHNNPVKANMCRYASEYRWSSFNAFYGAKNPLVNVSFSYNIAGSKDSLLFYFAKSNNSCEDNSLKGDHQNIRHFLTDKKALALFKKISNLTSLSDVSGLGKVQRNQYVRSLKTYGLTIKQIARIMDISEATVKRICKMTL
ncbi:MAG: transposase [Lachnospiraceae bacterium]|nr:transposase [Lachnospiraceae bacterium]